MLRSLAAGFLRLLVATFVAYLILVGLLQALMSLKSNNDWILTAQNVANTLDSIDPLVTLKGWITSSFPKTAWWVRPLWFGAVFTVVTALDQFSFLKNIQEALFPPLPAFLRWDEADPRRDPASPWNRRMKRVGRDREFAELHRFVRRSAKLLFQGAFGQFGVGKTHLAVLLMRHYRDWRRFWHCGELTAVIPPNWTASRPTLIYIDYHAHADLFWASLPNLRFAARHHPIRVLLETSMDFELMVVDRPHSETAFLRQHLATHRITSTEGVSRPTTTVAHTEMNDPSDASEKRLTDFIRIDPLDQLVAERVLARFARASRQHLPPKEDVEKLIEASQGRPKYLFDLSRFLNSAARQEIANQGSRINPHLVDDDEASRLIDEAVSAFPEEGLRLVLLAAFGIERDIPSNARHALLPSTGDKRKLARVFRNQAASPRHVWQRDLDNWCPVITNKDVALKAIMAILTRMPLSDVERFASEMFSDTQSGDAIIALMEGLNVLIGCRASGQTNTIENNAEMHCAVIQAIDAQPDPAVSTALGGYLIENDVVSLEDSYDDILHAARAFSCFIRSALRLRQAAPLQFVNELTAFVSQITRKLVVQSSDMRARVKLLKALSYLLPMHNMGLEIGRLADHTDAMRSQAIGRFIDTLAGSRGERTAGYDSLIARLRGDGDGLSIDDEVEFRCASLIGAMDLLDEASDALQSSHRDLDREDIDLIIHLFRDVNDPLAQFFAAWVCYWLIRAMDLRQFSTLPDAVIDALVEALNHPRTDKIVWSRAAAILAKTAMGTVEDDIMLDWARWIDGGRKTPARIPTPSNAAMSSRLMPALRRANLILSNASENSPIFNLFTALFLLAFNPENSVTMEILGTALTDPLLLYGRRKDLCVRLVQNGGTTAAISLAHGYKRAVRGGVRLATTISSPIFLALCVLNATDQFDIYDLASPNSALDRDTWLQIHAENGPIMTPSAGPTREDDLLTRKIANSGHLIHKLKAKDTTGRWAYYFVLVEEDIEKAFLAAISGNGNIDLEDYGVVIASSYGEQPTTEVSAYLKERYGFDV